MWSNIELHTKDSELSPKGLINPSISNYKELIRSCIDCHTTTTPCWRGGPAGPRTLCNACGIRYRKQRRHLLGSKQGVAKRSYKKKITPSGRSNLKVPLKLGLGILLQEDWRRKLGEEEQAAILLMALSSGSGSLLG